MKKIYFSILLMSTVSFGQDRISELINALAKEIVYSDNGKYFLTEKSLSDSNITDSLSLYFPREFFLKNPNFPKELLGKINVDNINWRKFSLENANCITEKESDQIVNTIKYAILVDKNISETALLKIKDTLDLNTFIVKRDKKWKRQEMWIEAEKTWNEIPVWRKIYFSFSAPVFSNDYKFARVAVSENRKCSGEITVFLYKNEDNIWVKIEEFPAGKMKKSTSHVKCEDFLVSFKN